MAFQETVCSENEIGKECEINENSISILKSSKFLEANKCSNDNFSNGIVTQIFTAQAEKVSNHLVNLSPSEICGGNADEKNDNISNGHMSYSEVTDELNTLGMTGETVDLFEVEGNCYSTAMKHPELQSEKMEEQDVGDGDCKHVLDSSVMPMVTKTDAVHFFNSNIDGINLLIESQSILEHSSNLISSSGPNADNFSNVTCNEETEIGTNLSSKNSSSNTLDSDQPPVSPSVNNNQDLENVEHDCLLHPTYIMALHEIEEKENKITELGCTVQRLKELLNQESSKSQRINELEQKLSHREKELSLVMKEQEIDKQSFNLIKKEMENKCALLKKDIELANRDKENMVMRYAVSEKELIDVRKEKETVVKKLKETLKENETLLDRMKNLVNDKSKLSQILDTKNTDLSAAHKEIDKLKEEINARDIKIKWTQNKLKSEMETHKECPTQIEKLTAKVRSLEEELNTAKQDCQSLKKKLDESEQNKILESQLKEEQAKLIMERHEHSEIDTKFKALQSKYQSMIEENNSLSFQVQNLETERLELEKKLSSSREDTERLSNSVSELQSKLVELDSLNSQLKQSEDKIETLVGEIERVRHQNEELLQDMSACRARESEMLSFTQKLTTKNVQLQSEFSSLEAKASELEKKDEKNRVVLKELKGQLNKARVELSQEKAKREEETRLLARQVAERTKKGDAIEADLADAKANLTQSKQKHATIVKELQRELSQLKKKLDACEASGLCGQGSANSVSETPCFQACEVPREVLVERILKLQADTAKMTEKIEFLEDHSAQLLAQVQKQSRLLQSYMLREEAGALAPSFLDSHKAEVSKHGGIMASLYSSTQQDDGMSLELSLEINRKLQSVLEDTLLKNIMLKENLDTLGDEISRLTGKK